MMKKIWCVFYAPQCIVNSFIEDTYFFILSTVTPIASNECFFLDKNFLNKWSMTKTLSQINNVLILTVNLYEINEIASKTHALVNIIMSLPQ